jgi:uncharacterized protein YndB with AHSA1/START domain
MFLNLFGKNKKKEIKFNRAYEAPIEAVWQAWTDPEILKQWWGPKNTSIPECKIDLRVGGEIYIVMQAGEGMGKYSGMKWPMKGNFTSIEPSSRLTYSAKSWTEGEEATSTIEQDAILTLTEENGKTNMTLKVTINKSGVNAMLAAFGMKYGYKQQFEKLAELLNK